MDKFKVGDKVKCIEQFNGIGYGIVGKVYTVNGTVMNSCYIVVKELGDFQLNANRFELVIEEPKKEKVTDWGF